MNTEQKDTQTNMEIIDTSNQLRTEKLPDQSYLDWTKEEIKSTWEKAERLAGDAWDDLKRYGRDSVAEPPAHEPTSAEVYRLREPACGPSSPREPWGDLPQNYEEPVTVDGKTLEEVASNLEKAGTPLHPGDVVTLDGGGAHVFDPNAYALAANGTPGAAAPWYEGLVTPELAAVAVGAFVTVKLTNYVLEKPRPRTIVEHGR